MSIQAKVILDSTNPYNKIRLITMELKYPRFIHADFMTHRLFSRNATSSRAMPTKKMVELLDDPATPVFWGRNQKGMSADEELNDDEIARAGELWLNASKTAIGFAEQLATIGLHKQITNRILEPWKHITVICSATHWTNFFRLRDHKDAQPEIQALAKAMKLAQDESKSVEREWHIPFIQQDEETLDLSTKCKVATARCARVSYLTHDGKRDIEKDLELHQRLLTGSDHGHWSPFEHVAQANSVRGPIYNWTTKCFEQDWLWCGNFQGWTQYRKIHAGEHLT